MQSSGERLQFIVKKLRLTNVYLAELLDVNPSSISRMLQMETLSRTRKAKLQKLEEKHLVNLEWIANGEGEPFLEKGKSTTDDKFEILRVEYEKKLALYEEVKNTQRETIEAQKGEIARLKEIAELQNKLIAEKEKQGK